MDTKKIIYLTILSLMLLSVFIFRQSILKLNNIQLLFTFVVAFVVLLVVTYYALKHRLKKSQLKEIKKLDYSILILPVAIIIYFGTALIFGAIGVSSIAIWMISLGFIVSGSYLLYFSKQKISEGRTYSIFGCYDKKKNYKAFIIVNVIDIIGGILLIGFGIFVLTALL